MTKKMLLPYLTEYRKSWAFGMAIFVGILKLAGMMLMCGAPATGQYNDDY